MASWYLLIIGEREALRWVLATQRMAFPPGRRRDALRLHEGDGLLLYTTRGAFHNPTRDRGRLIGEATVASPPVELGAPIEIANRQFTTACEIAIQTLAPLGRGVELAPLVPSLAVFPHPKSWSVLLRRPLLGLPPADARLLRSRLQAVAGEPFGALPTYL